MNHLFLSASFALLLLATSCGRTGSNTSSIDPGEKEMQSVQEIGKSAADSLITSLGGKLKSALQTGGPVAAIQVCQLIALPATAEAGNQFEGVQIRRTTLKPRNPANTPDKTDRAVLLEMEQAAKNSETPPEAKIIREEDVARYYRPLLVQEVCLNCHGKPDSFSPELKNTLATLYPADQATGYSPGELRGAIRVDIDRKQALQ
jgi:hypothetical protein